MIATAYAGCSTDVIVIVIIPDILLMFLEDFFPFFPSCVLIQEWPVSFAVIAACRPLHFDDCYSGGFDSPQSRMNSKALAHM